jgi:hypothetical protein
MEMTYKTLLRHKDGLITVVTMNERQHSVFQALLELQGISYNSQAATDTIILLAKHRLVDQVRVTRSSHDQLMEEFKRGYSTVHYQDTEENNGQ